MVEIFSRVASERRASVRLVGARELFPVLVEKTTERRPSTGRCPPKQLAARRQEFWLQASEASEFTDLTHVSNCHWHDGSLLIMGKAGGVAVGPVAVLTGMLTVDVGRVRTGVVVLAVLTGPVDVRVSVGIVVVVEHPLELTVAEYWK